MWYLILATNIVNFALCSWIIFQISDISIDIDMLFEIIKDIPNKKKK